jgi:hypothetical protein
VGTIGIASMGAGACPPVAGILLNANDSKCGNINLSTVKNGTVQIAPLPPTQGLCTGTPSGALPPPVDGRSCEAAKVGAGCPDGGACVTSPAAPFVACVAHDGALPCPTGFPNGSSVGASAADTRSCSACACGTSASCANPTLTFYSDGSCSSGAHDLPVTSACDPVNDGNGHNYQSFKYTADIQNGTCQTTTSSTPTGNLVLTSPRTICCK